MPTPSSAQSGRPVESNPSANAVVVPLRPARSATQAPPQHVVFRNREDWHAGLRRHVLPLDCSVAEPQSFQCQAVVASLRGNTVAELRVDATRLLRRAVDIQDRSGDVVKVMWQLAGRGHVQQGPNRSILEAGRWTILDPGREYAIELDKGARILVILVPRSECPGWLPALTVLAARALPAAGPAHIAMAALAAMLRDVAPLDTESETTLHDSIVALVERALTIELGAQGIEAPSERSIQLPQLQAYILDHLADAGLNVGKLATVFGVSRRSLYNIFAPSGVTPHSYIQSAKLDRACELLLQPSRQVSVGSVARSCGFADPAHFSRAFHARHGVAPTAWRLRVR
jgi:AraC family transcriptional regulator, positive regulator of tynA and feaB